MITHLHKMTFFLPARPKSSPVRVSSHRTSLLSVFEGSMLLPTAFSRSTTFFFLFTLVTINNFQTVSVKSIIHYMRQPRLAASCFGSFLFGGGSFIVFLLKVKKITLTLNIAKLLPSFYIFTPVSKRLRAGMRTQQVLLILIQDEDFSARHDITVFACATSSGFIPFSFAKTRMILSNIIWILFCLGCFDPCLNYFPVCPLKE